MFLAPELIHGYFTSNNRRRMLKSYVFKAVVSNTRSHSFAIKISGTFCILIIGLTCQSLKAKSIRVPLEIY